VITCGQNVLEKVCLNPLLGDFLTAPDNSLSQELRILIIRHVAEF
jgi:hypothetical protein